MNIGTKSVLYGAHCAIVHPWFLAVAWWKLYGFPWDIRLWAAFWLHDIGYFSKRDMDGTDGETHVELGARIMALLFGESWGAFTAAHSRYWAKRNGRQFSRLCVADKLAFVLTPAWLYLPMARATGELSEYMLRAKERQAGSEHFTALESAQLNSQDAREWLSGLKSYTRRWIEEHRDGGVRSLDGRGIRGSPRRLLCEFAIEFWRTTGRSQKWLQPATMASNLVSEGECKMAERSVNKAILVGRLGGDAETRHTQSGTPVSRVSLAMNRQWTDSDKQVHEETDWIYIVLWNKENLAAYLTKGRNCTSRDVYKPGPMTTTTV